MKKLFLLYLFNGFIWWKWKKKNRSLYYYLINCTTRNIKVIEWLSEPSPTSCNM